MVEEVTIRVRAEVEDAQRNIQDLRKEMTKTQGAVEKTTKSMENSASRLSRITRPFQKAGSSIKRIRTRGNGGVVGDVDQDYTANRRTKIASGVGKIGRIAGIAGIGAIGASLFNAITGSGAKLAAFDKLNAFGTMSMWDELARNISKDQKTNENNGKTLGDINADTEALDQTAKTLNDTAKGISDTVKNGITVQLPSTASTSTTTPSTVIPSTVTPSTTTTPTPSTGGLLSMSEEEIMQAMEEMGMLNFGKVAEELEKTFGSGGKSEIPATAQLDMILGAHKNIVNSAVSTHLSNMVQGAAEMLAGATVATKVTSALGNISNLGKGVVDTLGSVGAGIAKEVDGIVSGIGNFFGGIGRALRFAQGGVFEPNSPQLAILGDNKTEPEVAAPYSLIVRAVSEALRENRGPSYESPIGSTKLEVPISIDGKVIARAIYDDLENEKRRRNGVVY